MVQVKNNTSVRCCFFLKCDVLIKAAASDQRIEQQCTIAHRHVAHDESCCVERERVSVNAERPRNAVSVNGAYLL